MARLQRWFAEDPRRSPAEYACVLARDRFWRDERARLIGVHPEFPDVTDLLWLPDREDVAHALVLILSRMPPDQRLSFATVFFEECREHREGLWSAAAFAAPGDQRSRLAVGAGLALLVIDLAADAALREQRIVDLLHGAAQGDDLTITPPPAVDFLRKTIARVRFDPALEDDTDPHVVAAHAVVEVLDPSSEVVAVREVLARAAYATVECRERSGALGFLLEADRILADEGEL